MLDACRRGAIDKEAALSVLIMLQRATMQEAGCNMMSAQNATASITQLILACIQHEALLLTLCFTRLSI
jgi:hypothetical protein